MTYSGSLSGVVVLNGLLLDPSGGYGEVGVAGVGSVWRGSGVLGAATRAREVSYAIVTSMNSRKIMLRSRETRSALDGLYPGPRV